LITKDVRVSRRQEAKKSRQAATGTERAKDAKHFSNSRIQDAKAIVIASTLGIFSFTLGALFLKKTWRLETFRC
jgi:hypothetical protein